MIPKKGQQNNSGEAVFQVRDLTKTYVMGEVSVHALVGASDRYLATLDDHLVFELGDRVLLISFLMNR